MQLLVRKASLSPDALLSLEDSTERKQGRGFPNSTLLLILLGYSREAAEQISAHSRAASHCVQSRPQQLQGKAGYVRRLEER